jgi:hypothetical protein
VEADGRKCCGCSDVDQAELAPRAIDLRCMGYNGKVEIHVRFPHPEANASSRSMYSYLYRSTLLTTLESSKRDE